MIGTVFVKDVEEHEDGSATITFDVHDDVTRESLQKIGLEFVLYCAALELDMQDALTIIADSAEERRKNTSGGTPT
jgi:hypothetical protein